MISRFFKYILPITLCFSCRQSPDVPFDFSKVKKKLIPLHQMMGEPQTGDWLLYHKEKPMSFEVYQQSNPVHPTSVRNKIYVQPLGDFDSTEQKLVRMTAVYLQAYFGLTTKTLSAISDSKVPSTYRRPLCYVNYNVVKGKLVEQPDSLKEQLQTLYILDSILKPNLPDDAVAMIALCDKDLFPDETFNFVFGQAQLKNRVGVWSFFRFGDVHNANEFSLVLKRTLKTASHETGHMFSFKHCSKYKCIMNGSNHLEEADRKPTSFCPDCLEKFCWNFNQKPEQYFGRLMNFWKNIGDSAEICRYQSYLEALRK